jgi:CRP/FNR family transcriptional regulator
MKTERIQLREEDRVSLSARSANFNRRCDRCHTRSTGVCGSLEDKRLEQLAQTGGPKRWAKGEIMQLADTPARYIYRITKGVVAEYRTLDDGRRQIVAIRTVGDLCGYPTNNGKYLFSSQALTQVETCSFDRHRLEALKARDIDVARVLTEDVSEKLRRATEALTVLGQLKSTERVAHFLIELHELYRSRHVGPASLALHLTRQDIADYLGLTLETVSRSFSKLREDHVIALIGRDSVAILDREQLARIGKVDSGRSPPLPFYQRCGWPLPSEG